ncbi:PLP-dependent lyase/thiolase [Patescibacteria group bacterium]|nr:PLP-dependent lyase/thiolase [Patescibacteria group bacterium]MBU4452744.1 PLP-dependent lyase/thiolase [Patescibacteria group bacterium]MCG2687737.1 PLP-dependent lyase/thiolase [Candidatus Parcubacteria bacterium]
MTLTSQEEEILDSIHVPSDNDPKKPEFPPDNPKFPSTPTFEIQVPGMQNVWVKDESVNPTGTHKDRMAWEMVVTYKNLLLAKKAGVTDYLPHMSIISSGSAGIAIQKMLKKYRLPDLKVLVHFNMSADIKDYLKKIGCHVYETDLGKRVLLTDDILRLTDNVGGIDITSDDALGPFDVFYDWMSYDILNKNADWVFVPYGTGHLYENVINIAQREASSFVFHDRRFQGDHKKIGKCHFIGSTTNNPTSIADKLYSPHLPFVHLDPHWINLAKRKGHIGAKSRVGIVREESLQEAMKIAQMNDLTAEPSGIAGLAMLLQMKDEVPEEDKKLIVNTGKVKYE